MIASIAGISRDQDVDITTVCASSTIGSHRLTLNERIDGLNDRVDDVEELGDLVSGDSDCKVSVGRQKRLKDEMATGEEDRGDATNP